VETIRKEDFMHSRSPNRAGAKSYSSSESSLTPPRETLRTPITSKKAPNMLLAPRDIMSLSKFVEKDDVVRELLYYDFSLLHAA